MKRWIDFQDECPRCGDIAEVYTSAADGYAYDGDNAICKDCGLSGSVVCDGDQNDNGDTIAYVCWDDCNQ